MKTKFFGIAIFSILLGACNGRGKKPDENVNAGADSSKVNTPTADKVQQASASINGIVSGYLQLKNALVNDDGGGAAEAGRVIMEAVDKVDTSALSPAQKNAFADVADDIRENAEHCRKNGNKIEHQREHFDILSQDMYALVKSFHPSQTLYKDKCLMYNENKGAFWLSETKEIKNPYYGKKMLTCGVIKEEIK